MIQDNNYHQSSHGRMSSHYPYNLKTLKILKEKQNILIRESESQRDVNSTMPTNGVKDSLYRRHKERNDLSSYAFDSSRNRN